MHVPDIFSWLNKNYLHYKIFLLLYFYINNVINILFIKAKYESQQVIVLLSILHLFQNNNLRQ